MKTKTPQFVSTFLALLALVAGALTSQAQPDYAGAQYVPPACTKWYTTGNGHSFVVIHDMEGYYQTTISYLNRCDLDTNGNFNVAVSVYYAVNSLHNGSDTHGHHENNTNDAPVGEITQFVRESNYAWHVLCWNKYMFGTEHEGFVNDPAWYSQGMYQSSASLQRHLCDKYAIAKDRNHVIGHDEWQTASWTNWMSTNWPAIDTTCNDHTDPGQYWNWTYFMSLINADTNVTGTYWDLNGTTAGFGATPTGTWGLSVSNWNGVAAGTGTKAVWVSPANAIFNADTATNAFTVTIVGTQTVYSVQVLTGNPTFNGGGLNFTGTGTYYSNYVAAGQTATFNTPFTSHGLGAPDKWGAGTAVYNSPATVGSSYMTLNQGTIAVGDDGAFGTNKFNVGEPTGANAVTLKSANTTTHNLANTLIIYATNFIVGANADMTFSGNDDLRTTIHALTVSNNNATFSGSLTNTGGITKAGPGTLILSGASANTYSGATAVSAGTLKLSKSSGVNAVAGSSLTINSGGTLLLGGANQIANTVPLTMAGGVLNTGGFSETAGTLKLMANSLIDLATGATVLNFAASSGVAWTAATTLTISNWNGSVTGGGSDQVFFGTTSAGLSAGQLAQVVFVNPPGFDPGTYAAVLLSTGEVVPASSAPSITTQPSDLTVIAGQNAAFSVAVSGTSPFAYQWTFNAANISGATASSYTVTGAQPADAGAYAVVIGNVAGSATSTSAALTVNVPPSITAQPSGQAVTQGQNATFTVTAAGTAPLAYQWRLNTLSIIGATDASYTRVNCQSSDAGSYSCQITNVAGSIISADAILVVNTPPTINTQPASALASVSNTVVFTVSVSGTSPLSYQWNKNGTAISGATLASLTLTALKWTNAGSYTVVVTNAVGSVTSATATLTVQQADFSWVDGFESYALGGLDKNLSGGPNTNSTNPWWGVPTLPDMTVFTNRGGVTPHGGSKMISATTNIGICQEYLNLPFRLNAGSNYYGNLMMDWWFYDTKGAGSGSTNYVDYIALAQYAPVSLTNDFTTTTFSNFNQRMSLGAYNGTGYHSNVYQARIVGATGGFNVNGWFNTGTTRSVGWHHGRILVGIPVANSGPVQMFIDNMTNATFSYSTSGTNFGFNLIEINCAFGGANTGGYFDDFTFRAANDPWIAQQPVNTTVATGGNTSFTTVAIGTAYQWQLNGANISGATATSYSITGASAGDAGTYDCVITGANGTTNTTAVTLTVQ